MADVQRIIGQDSPLKRLPDNIDRTHILFYDGIRFTIEMIDVSYQQLTQSLFQISTQIDKPLAEPLAESLPMALPFLHAWSIVDSAYRLRSLVSRLPGIKYRDIPEREVYLRSTSAVEDLRHVFQHLDEKVPELIKIPQPTWGSISWVTWLNQKLTKARISIMIPGHLFKMELPLAPPPTAKKHFPVASVVLTSLNTSLSLTDTYVAVVKIACALERELGKRRYGLQHGASDVYVKVDWEAKGRQPD